MGLLVYPKDSFFDLMIDLQTAVSPRNLQTNNLFSVLATPLKFQNQDLCLGRWGFEYQTHFEEVSLFASVVNRFNFADRVVTKQTNRFQREALCLIQSKSFVIQLFQPVNFH